MVDRTAPEALLVVPSGRGCDRLCLHGIKCRAVLAVFPLVPVPDRQGVLIPRQVGHPPAFLYLEDRRVLPEALLLYLWSSPSTHVPCVISA